MKRIIFLLTLALLACLFFGCGEEEENSDSLYFGLESLPDIGEYKPEGAQERWYDDYVGVLIPSEDYGPLRPYCGNIVKFDSCMGDSLFRYGLCTEDGVIVTDPAYTDISRQGDWYILCSDEIKRESSDKFDYASSYYLAKTDGSVCRHIGDSVRTALFVWDNLISVYLEDKVQLQDYDGKVVAEFPNAYLWTSGDYLLVGEHVDFSDPEYENRTYLFDRSLKKIAGPISDIFCIGNKFYYTYDRDGTTRLFNMQGEELLTHLDIKQIASCDDGILLVSDGKNAHIYDYDMKLLSSVNFGRITGINFLGKKVLIVNSANSSFRYTDLEGNALDYDYVSFLTDHYVMRRGTTTYIADTELNIVEEIDGKYYGNDEDVESELIYLATDICTSAYSLKTHSFVAENVNRLYSGPMGFYCRYKYEVESLKYDCEIYRAEDGELVYRGEMPTFMDLGDKIYLFAQVGDFAVTYDEDFNEISKIRINKD